MDAREVELIYELSPMQQAMLFHSLYAPGTGVYVIQQSLRLTGRLDVPALERAWQSLVDRHGILRTAFFWEDLEKPLQVVHRQAPLAIARESWRGLSVDEQREKLARALAADLERGFDLTEPPLFRLALFELDEDVHQLVWSYHHLLSDGWSQGLLLRELFTAYAAHARGDEPALPKPRPFRDYISWLQRQDLEKAEAFWRQSLAGFSSPTFVLEPHLQDERPEGPRPEDSRRAVLPLAPEAGAALRDAARRHRLTLNTLLQGAWALLLSRMTGSDDVVFGTTVSGRPADLPGVESIIGLFINTLPVRTEVRPEQRLDEWLAALQQRQVEIRRFEHSPLVEVQRWSELPPGTPLFDHILVFENLALPGEVSAGLQGLAIQEEAASTSTNFPLNVVVIPGSRLTLTALYDAARFHGAEVTRLLERLAGVLAVFATDQDPRLGEIPVLLEAERQQALVEHNDTRSAYPGEASLPELFAEVAREHPDAPALIDPAGEVWSYRRLDEESNRLARRLLGLGVGPESAVGISMERSAELILGTLAILKAGGIYVPLDSSYPDERLVFMLEDTGGRLVLVHAATRERLAGLASVLDVDEEAWRSEEAFAPGVRVPSESLAYVIYTSGSTGRPKGVAVPHRAIARLVRDTNYVRLGPGDRTSLISNISFDAATYEIWGALLTGAAVAVIARDVVLSPLDFAAAIRERGITSLFLTSALFAKMAREMPDAFAPLSELMTGGEAVDPAAVRAVLAGRPPRRLIDVYGPTESTTFATWFPIAEAPEGKSIPIGRALANTTLYLLDRSNAPVPPGSPGELCIGGDGLARGYLNRPELTAEKFVPHPWAAGERLYRTGDLVRQRWDGAVEYLGRLDHQVKIRGFRIEPGEIETALAGHPGIRECIVLARRDAGPSGDLRLVAYVVADVEPAVLRAWLQERLPDYMVPGAWVALESLPLTANGKVDRRALPAPERTGSADADSAPSDVIEERIAAIWGEVLGLERVGVHDDFFALGGHSLLATQVVSRVRAAFEVELPLRDLFDSPTVAGLARAVRTARGEGVEAPPLTPVSRTAEALLSPGQTPARQPLAAASLSPGRLEEVLADLWAEVLGVERVGLHEDFFALGGHSLLASRVSYRVRDLLGVELPLRALFENPTVARFAQAVRAAGPAEPSTLDGTSARSGALPLSFAQQRLWLIDQLEPGSAAYNVPFPMRLRGAVSPRLLEETFAEIVARHEVLRTTFAVLQGQPAQVIAEAREPELPLVDLSALPEGARDAAALALVREEARWPFDLAGGPLLRLTLLRLAGDEHVLLTTMHHIVSDGWSMGVLLREIAALYPALLQGLPSPLPPLPLQYADFAVWQRGWLQGEVLRRQLDHWRERLDGAPRVLELPTDRPRPPRRSFRGGSLPVALPSPLAERVRAIGQRQGATPFMVLLAAWGLLLGRHAGQEDVLLGSPIAGRNRGEIEDLIGFFVNTLVLRVNAQGSPGFGELLGRVRAAALDAFAHQDVPFERLVEELAVERDLAVTPLFQAMFALQNAPVGELALPGLSLAPVPLDSGLAKFDLSLGLGERGDGFAGTLEHDADLFDTVTAERLWRRFAVLLEAAADAPEIPVADLPMLLPAEREQLAAWNGTGEESASGLCLHELFALQAERTPDAVALIHEEGEEGRSTYAELAARAGALALHLRSLGVGPEVRVAVCLERSPDLIASLLGVLAAGGAYVPVDPAYPVERRALMLEDSAAAVLVTRGTLAADLPAAGARVLDLDVERLPSADGLPSGSGVGPHHLAYVIYTSGSTGRPKGVAIEHRSAVALAGWAREVFSPDELSGMLAATSVCFDLSVFEIFVPLAWGGTIVLAENALALANHPAADRVRLLNTVPSAATELLRLGGLPASVRTVCLAGEPLPAPLAAGLYATGTVRRVMNLYGPSEDTTYSTGTVVPMDTGRAPSIGRPLPGTRAWVVDRRGSLVPPGVAGELWLAGAGLARAYLGRPELTAERFTPDPFGEAGERVYRTGDLVRHPSDGNLNFLGRIDHQVKIRGFRVELGEIEAALAAWPGVRSCAVLAREDVPGVHQLVAYLAGEALPDDAALRSALGARLPEHMIPAVFVRLEALPLSPNGKVDRRSLPAPDRARRSGLAEYVAPRTPTEEILAGIWQELLGLERVGVEDRFFDLGGHSLLATQVLARVRETLGVDLPLRRLFEHPTVARLAQAVGEARREGEAAPPIVTVPREKPLPLSFAQTRLWLVDQLDPDSPAYNMPFPVRLRGGVQPALLRRIFAELVARHESLRTTFTTLQGEPAQVIAPASGPAPELPLLDLSALPEAEREAAATRLVLEDTLRPFDLRRGPLLRLALLRLGADDHVLLMTMHHIVSDGWSMGVLLREVAALYRAFSQGNPSPLPPLPVQSADFAVWQHGWLQGQVLDRQIGFWKQRLAGAPHVLELPTDRPRPAVQSLRGASRPVSLPPALSARVREISRARKATPFMTLLTAWALLLGRHAGQPDVLVGTPVAGRNRREVEGLIGFFVNTLVLRVDARGDAGGPGFGSLLGRVREETLDAFAHQDVPFERLVEELVPERDLSRAPLFQAMFALQNAPIGELTLPGLALAPVAYENRVAKLDLSLALGEAGGVFVGSLDHNVDLFDAATPARFWARFEALLEEAAADPGRPVADLPLLLPAERHQVLLETNADRDLSPSPSLPELFLERAAAAPEAPALVLAGSPSEAAGSLTYADLERRSARLARHLRGLGVGPEVRVAVCAGRSPRTLVGLLAVLRAGGAYLPLDPAWPADRMAWMLEDAGAALVLTDRETAGRLPPLGNDRIRSLLFLEDEPADRPEIRLEPPIATQAAYVIYTSGSTGRPKGVVALHGGLAAFSRALADAMELAPGDRVLQYASLSFDASAVEIWPALIRGAAVAVHPDPTALSARELLALSASEGWTVVNLPAAPWRQMVQDVEEAGGSFPAGVRLFLTGGESLSPEALRQWRRVVAPEARLLSCYGPTETTVIVSLYEASAGQPDGAPALGAPLGDLLPGTALYLLDGRLAPVPLDVPGEVYLGGPWVTRGYLGRPAQTAAVFLPDPWGPPGARLYRTGDRARLRPDGGLEFLGRIDQQVKIRGFRVEPGEIETVLAGHPEVRECAVLARRDGGTETRLVAYVVPQPPADLDARSADPRAALRAWLRERLPEALVPSAFVLLDAFPTSTSGKIDRQALPAPERVRGTDGDHVPPGDPLEKALAGVWEELLGVERVGVHDDFFALGGHSLLATRVVSRVRDLFGVELPLRRLFAQPTVAALARLVREAQREGGGRAPAIVPVSREDWPDGLPLSFAQQRLWFLEQLEPGNAAYHMPQAVRLTGRVSADLLERIFGAIVARHEALRTTFVSRGEQPVQVIAPAAGETEASRPVLRVIDLSGLPEAEREERALALAKLEALRPFDLRTGPLLRQTLVRLNVEDEADDHLLLLNVHHIVSDGWSMGVLLGEIAELYRAFSAGEAPRLPALPVQYADYAVWQRGWLQGEVLAAELAWWREQLTGLPPLLELPTDRPRPPVQSFRGGQLGLRLPAELADRLRALAHREGATLFMALLAGFQTLLARSSGQDQIAVGSPIAGRNHSEIESLIGFFVNTLVLRGDLSASSSDLPGFRELVGRARERALGAYAHQEVPFEKLVEELAPERSLAHAPLFQVMLVLQNTAEPTLALEGLHLRPVDTGSAGAKFDLTLSLQERAGEIVGGLTYASDLFDAATLRRFLDRFERLLAAALADPAAPWTELPLLSPAETGQLLEWTDTAAPVPLERLLHERIADRARQAPDADAVIAPDGRLSFAALDRRANQLARHLFALGVAPESRVALCMDRSLDLIVGLLAALKAGAAFVVVDPAQPLPRLSRVLRDAAPAAVLTREPAGSGLPEDLADDLAAPVVWLDREAAQIALQSLEEPRTPVDPEQAAYVVYTSGSTGTPKGVVIRHGAVLNLLAALERTVYAGAGPGLRVSVNAPLYFDGAIKQVIQLAQGRTLCLVPDEVRADAHALGRYLTGQRVDVLDCTPAQLRALLESEAPLPARLLVGGEAVDQALWDRLAHLPGTASFNVYGPSECTVDTTARRIAPDAPRPVLGRPLVNVRAHVMSAALLPQPPGIPGELWIGGAGVARGYLGRPDLTAERFVPDPFSVEPGARLYRTGDLVRWSPEGELEFLGRTDHQVKVRGFRIELGEIEAVLGSHPSVRDGVVLVREEQAGDRRLVAWVALQESGSTSPADLAAWLRDRLPAYMVPASFGVLGELPLTSNGKVDRRALAALVPESPAGEDRYVPPSGPVEEMLAGIWAEVLGVERVGSRDGFFELGGHSLLATRVTSRVREQLGVELPLRALFESPTLADLARAVRMAREPEGAAPPLLPIPPHERGVTFPLSFAQQRLWFLDQIEPGNPAYVIPLPVRVRGELASELLERILAEIVARHEALRTTFAVQDGAPVQVVHADLRPELRRFDLSDLPEAGREEQAGRLVADEARRPFDLAAGPLVRLALVRLGERDQILLLALHHIVSDGWSMGVLLREIGLLLEAFAEGRPSPLPPLPVQYPDYAVWQRGWLQGDVLRGQLDHWKRRLAGAPQVLELPADRPRPPVQTFRGAASSVVLPPPLAEGVRALCRREGTTPYMALLAAWAVLLGRHAGQDDLLLGSPIAGRNRRETEELIGLFINTLVLRADLREESGPLSFQNLLGRVRETALDAFAHQDVPFERLVEELVEERNLAVSPLFQVLFTLQNTPRDPFQPAGLTLEPVEVASGVAKVDLSLTLSERPVGIVGSLEHNSHLFDAATAERLVARFAALLEAAAADPGRALGDLPLLLPAEVDQALSVWNPVTRSAAASCLHNLISRQALRTPDAVAVADQSGELTYRELDARSNQMAHHLLALGVTVETPVGVRLDRSPGLLVALLGILKAGGAYVPLDPSWPAERTAFVLAAAGVSLVLDQLPETGHRPAHSPAVAVDPGQLAYVLFTSGSTGAPKGVMVQHASVVRYLEWSVKAYGLAPGRRSLLHSPLGFDLTVTALFAPLLAGGEVRLVPESAGVETIQELTRALDDGGDVQLLKLTPAHLEILGGELDPAAAARVGTLVVGGDALRGAALGVWRTGAPETLVVNEYGPTEATVGCCVHAAHAGEIGDGRVPIGHPIDGARLHVVDRHGQLLPPGARGELLIGGDGLARGYLGRPDLTAERFLPDPWATRPGDRLYRTGDLVVRRADGSLDFLGRNDHQVKVRGFRIELGEIEAVLGRHPEVREVVVIVREDVPGDRVLAAYAVFEDTVFEDAVFEGEEAGEAGVDGLRAYAAERLPSYMVPAAIVPLRSLPLTPNGKVDRKALPAPERVRSGPAFLGPRDALELEVARIWEELLNVRPVGVRDDFFALGGHSLLAAQLTARLRGHFGREVPLVALLRAPTVERLAVLLRDDAEPEPQGALVELGLGNGTPFFLVHPVGGEVLSYVHLARHLSSGQSVYGLRMPDGAAPPETIEEMAASYLREIREAQPEGPYTLGGWSLGGVVAFEMARQLEARGESVEAVVLIDSFAPDAALAQKLSGGALVASFAFDLARGLGLQLAGPPADLAGLEVDEALCRLAERAEAAGLLPPGLRLADLERRFARFAANLRAVERYTGGESGARLLLVRAAERPAGMLPPPADLGWNRLARRPVEVHELPGDHYSLLQEPIAGILAALVRERLANGSSWIGALPDPKTDEILQMEESR